MKKVLITGGAGFIGANFVYKYLELGHEVFIAEREGVDLWRLQKAQDKIRVCYTDLTNYDVLEALIAQIKPQIVLHFATYGAYQKTQQNIDAAIDTNLKGTINLVNACQKVGVECFINTGSSSEYGIKDAPMKEGDRLEADNLYGITKAASTLYCQMIARKSGFPVVIVRPCSVFGYFEEPGRLIPDIITAYVKNVPPQLSTPASVRDFIFIEDFVDGYLAIIKNITAVKGEIVNLGSGREHTIGQVVKIVQKLCHSFLEPTYGTMKKSQTEPAHWVADISKAKKMLGWKPTHTLEQGLKKDVEWFRQNLHSYE